LLPYYGPAIDIDTDGERAAAIIDRILGRCPDNTRADLMLVTRVLGDRQRPKDLAPARKTSSQPRAKRRS
jgi:hypothetical protein